MSKPIIIGESDRMMRDAKLRIAADAKAMRQIPKDVIVLHVMEMVDLLAVKDDTSPPKVLRALANAWERHNTGLLKEKDNGVQSGSDN